MISLWFQEPAEYDLGDAPWAKPPPSTAPWPHPPKRGEGSRWGGGRTGRGLRERIQAALANERARPAGHAPNPGARPARPALRRDEAAALRAVSRGGRAEMTGLGVRDQAVRGPRREFRHATGRPVYVGRVMYAERSGLGMDVTKRRDLSRSAGAHRADDPQGLGQVAPLPRGPPPLA